MFQITYFSVKKHNCVFSICVVFLKKVDKLALLLELKKEALCVI